MITAAGHRNCQACNRAIAKRPNLLCGSSDWKLSGPTIHLFIVNEVRPSDARYRTQTLRNASNRNWSFLVMDHVSAMHGHANKVVTISSYTRRSSKTWKNIFDVLLGLPLMRKIRFPCLQLQPAPNMRSIIDENREKTTHVQCLVYVQTESSLADRLPLH